MLCWKYIQHTSLVMNLSKVNKPQWEGKNNYCLALIHFSIKYKGKNQLFVLELVSWVSTKLLLKCGVQPGGRAAQPGGRAKEGVERLKSIRGFEEEIDWWKQSLLSLRHLHQTSHYWKEKIPSCTFPSLLHQWDGESGKERE